MSGKKYLVKWHGFYYEQLSCCWPPKDVKDASWRWWRRESATEFPYEVAVGVASHFRDYKTEVEEK